MKSSYTGRTPARPVVELETWDLWAVKLFCCKVKDHLENNSAVHENNIWLWKWSWGACVFGALRPMQTNVALHSHTSVFSSHFLCCVFTAAFCQIVFPCSYKLALDDSGKGLTGPHVKNWSHTNIRITQNEIKFYKCLLLFTGRFWFITIRVFISGLKIHLLYNKTVRKSMVKMWEVWHEQWSNNDPNLLV